MNRDLLTIAYDSTGKVFRKSPQGKLLKFLATNDVTKSIRDKLLEGQPEHVKRFIQYLSGGTVGNKPITDLPEHIRQDVIKAHFQKPTADNPFSGYPEKDKLQLAGSNIGKPNPDYNPDSTQLQLYHQSNEAAYSLGNVQFKQSKDGTYTLTDTYKVDAHNSKAFGPYKPFRTVHSDLLEGKRPASFAYDVSSWLGLNKDMQYNVKFEDLKINK